MERLEDLKKSEEEKVAGLRAKEVTCDPPTNLESYKELLQGLRLMAESPKSHITRDRIIRSLVDKIEVTPDGFKIYFHLGKEYVNQELARWGRSSPIGGLAGSLDQNFKLNSGSNELTFGAPGRARSCVA
jgi:hypothetical protein